MTDTTVTAKGARRRLVAGGGLALAAALLLAACSSSSTPKANATTTTTTPPVTGTLNVSTSSLGRILVDRQGFTVYMLTAGTPSAPACTGKCLTIWPPLIMGNASPTPGTGVDGAKLGVAVVNGQHQLTYNGHLLYTYSGDPEPGPHQGEGLPFPAPPAARTGTWYVLAPSGLPVLPSKTSSSSSTSTTGKSTTNTSGSSYG